MSTNLTWNIFLRGSNVAGQLSCSLHPFPVPANSDQEIPQTLCTMPRLRPVQDCRQHPDGICECYRAPPQASQSMEELDYLRSACAAAQEGNTTRLEEILRKCPEALQDDGHRGRHAEPARAVEARPPTTSHRGLQAAQATRRCTMLPGAGMVLLSTCC